MARERLMMTPREALIDVLNEETDKGPGDYDMVLPDRIITGLAKRGIILRHNSKLARDNPVALRKERV